jgi:hypothetical protein
MKAVSLQSLMAVIERHKLEPVNGRYNLTKKMFKEAAALDRASGHRPPSPEELAAIVEGKELGWEEVSEEDLRDERTDGKRN